MLRNRLLIGTLRCPLRVKSFTTKTLTANSHCISPGGRGGTLLLSLPHVSPLADTTRVYTGRCASPLRSRAFSSAGNIRSRLTNLIEQLQGHPVGTLPSDLFQDAQKALLSLDASDAMDASRIWERLVTEHISSQNLKSTWISIDYLHNVLNALQQQCHHPHDDSIANRAQDLVINLEKHATRGYDVPHPTLITYTVLMDILAKSPSPQSAQQAKSILDKLQDSSTEKPDLVAFNTLLSAWATSPQPLAQEAESLLRRMTVSPDIVSFSCVIKAWCQQCQHSTVEGWHAVKRAESLLDEMQTVHSLHPDTKCLHPILLAYSHCASENDVALLEAAASHSQTLLEKAVHERGIKTNSKCWEAVLWAWTKMATAACQDDSVEARHAAEHASTLLADMMRLCERGVLQDGPSSSCYAAVIVAWTKAGDPQRAQQLLQHALTLPTIEVQVSTWNVVLHAWSIYQDVSTSSSAPPPVWQLFQEMKENQGNASAAPDERTCAIVMRALAKMGDAQRAQELYDDILANKTIETKASHLSELLAAWSKAGQPKHVEKLLWEAVDKEAPFPDVACFHAVFDSWARHGEPQKAEAVLRRQQRLHKECKSFPHPDATGYAIVMGACAKHGDPDRTLELMKELQHVYEETGDPDMHPTTACFNVVLEAWCLKGKPARAEELLNEAEANGNPKPDAASYCAVLHGWSQQSKPHLAENLLVHMQDLYVNGRSTAAPDMHCFTAVLNAWAKIGDAERADAVFRRMLDLHQSGSPVIALDTVCFNSTINAWARSRHPAADQRAQELLEHMMSLYKEGHASCQPDTVTFSSVLHSLAVCKRNGNVERGEKLLQRLNQLYQDGNISAKPDTICYNSLLNVIGRSQDANRVSKAHSLLNQMEDQYRAGNESVRPDVRSFNTVVLCCAYSERQDPDRRRVALEVATATLNRLRDADYCQANSYSYDAFFKACSRLAQGEERIELVQKAFRWCCSDGLLNQMVFKSLSQAVPHGVLSSMVTVDGSEPIYQVQIEKLPRSWSRNATDKGQNRKNTYLK